MSLPGSPMRTSERRIHSRRDEPYLVVSFNGHDYTSASWSFGGMLVSGYYGDLGLGALISIVSMAVGDEPAQAVKVHARVVRADSDSGHLAVTFLDIDAAAYGLLARRCG